MIYNIDIFECFRYIYLKRRSISFFLFILLLRLFSYSEKKSDAHHNLSGVQFIVTDVLLRFIIFVSQLLIYIYMWTHLNAFVWFCFLSSFTLRVWNIINIYQFIIISLENFMLGALTGTTSISFFSFPFPWRKLAKW